MELERATQYTRKALQMTSTALQKIYRPKYAYKMLDLTDQHRQQLSLIDTPQTEEERQRSPLYTTQ